MFLCIFCTGLNFCTGRKGKTPQAPSDHNAEAKEHMGEPEGDKQIALRETGRRWERGVEDVTSRILYQILWRNAREVERGVLHMHSSHLGRDGNISTYSRAPPLLPRPQDPEMCSSSAEECNDVEFPPHLRRNNISR